MSYSLTLPKTVVNDISLKNILAVGIGSLFIAICSQLSLTIPFISLVPFSLQCSAVLLISALLGSKRAFFSVALYLIEGASGLPFFANGRSGLLCLMGPTGGYLLSYLMVSYLTGRCFEMISTNSWSTRVAIFSINNGLILFCGVCWLSLFIGWENSWKMGAYPFLGTDLLKNFVIASGLPVIEMLKRKIVEHFEHA